MDDRATFSDLNAELAEVTERTSKPWIDVRKIAERMDPSPRAEIVRTFFRDAMERESKIH